MFLPEKEKYLADAKEFKIVPVYKEIDVDLETPISLFLKLNGKFLLESVEKGNNVGRYTIIALDCRSKLVLNGKKISITEYSSNKSPISTNKECENPLLEVRNYMKQFTCPEHKDLPPFFGGLIGYLGYETVSYFEKINVSTEPSEVPDGILVLPKTVLVFDAVKRSLFIIVSSMPGTEPELTYKKSIETINSILETLKKPLSYPESFTINDQDTDIHRAISKEDHCQAIKIAKEHIYAGNIIQAVISQPFYIKTSAPPFEIYRTLRMLNPSPYMFYLDFDDFKIVGSSPEVMVRVQENKLLLKPIAGTRKRGENLEEDNALAEELINDQKEVAEHLMLVDLGRNDLGRVAKAGTVKVRDYMTIERYSHVMHIVSTVVADMDDNFDAFDVIKATFPAGTLSGAPKVRAMEIISEVEKSKRGPYGGLIMNLGYNGNLDSCITIRTFLHKDGVVNIQAGGGIVYDSDLEDEYQETINKASAIFKAVEKTREKYDPSN